jgi:hypothetical protein
MRRPYAGAHTRLTSQGPAFGFVAPSPAALALPPSPPRRRWPDHRAATLGGQGHALIRDHRSKGRKASPVSPPSRAYSATASPCVVTTQVRPKHRVRVAGRLVQPSIECPAGAHALAHTHTRSAAPDLGTATPDPVVRLTRGPHQLACAVEPLTRGSTLLVRREGGARPGLGASPSSR